MKIAMNFKSNAKKLGAWRILAGAGMVGCAGGPPDRGSIDARALSARTAGEHQAVASEYQALAGRQAEASVHRGIRGREEDRMALFKNEGRGIRSHPSIMAAQWQMQAAVEARAAEEARALAKQHRGMADAGR